MAPELNYKNKVWSAKDILEEVKRDMIKTLWSQRGDLVSQMMMKTSMFRSKKSLRQIAGLNTEVEKHSKHGSPKSPLRFSVQPSTPLDMDDDDSPTSGSTSYPESLTSTLANRTASPEETLVSRRSSGRKASSGFGNGEDADDEGDVRQHKRHGLFGRVDADDEEEVLKGKRHGEEDVHKTKRHGLFGKLRRHSKGEEDIVSCFLPPVLTSGIQTPVEVIVPQRGRRLDADVAIAALDRAHGIDRLWWRGELAFLALGAVGPFIKLWSPPLADGHAQAGLAWLAERRKLGSSCPIHRHPDPHPQL